MRYFLYEQYSNAGDKKKHKNRPKPKDEKESLSDVHSPGRNSRESKHLSNQGNDKENSGPL